MLFRAWKRIALLIAWFVMTGCERHSSNDITDNGTRYDSSEDSQVFDSVNENTSGTDGTLLSPSVPTENTTAFSHEEVITVAVNEPDNEVAVGKAKTSVNGSDINNVALQNNENEDYDHMKVTTAKSDHESRIGDGFEGIESPNPRDLDQVVTEGVLVSNPPENSQRDDNMNNDDVLLDDVAEIQSKENELKAKPDSTQNHPNLTSVSTTMIINGTTTLSIDTNGTTGLSIDTNDTTLFSSPQFFTRAYQFHSVSDNDYDFERSISSSRSLPTVYPYGSRFQTRQSSYPRGISLTVEVTPSWPQEMYSSTYTADWDSRFPVTSVTSCVINTCDYRSVVGNFNSHFHTPVLEYSLSSSFPQTDLGYTTINNYKGDEYIEPTFGSIDILKSSLSYEAHTPYDEGFITVGISIPRYASNNGLFGIRISQTSSPMLPTVYTSFIFHEQQTDFLRATTPTLDITSDNTIAVELQRNRKESDNRNSYPSVLEEYIPNGHLSVGNIGTQFLRTAKIDDAKINALGVSNTISQEVELLSAFLVPPTSSHKIIHFSNSSINSSSDVLQQNLRSMNPSIEILPTLSSMFNFSRLSTSPVVVSSSASHRMISSSFLQNFHDAGILNSRYSNMEQSLSGNREDSNIKEVDCNFTSEATAYEKNAIPYTKEEKQMKHESYNQPEVNHSSIVVTNVLEFNSSERPSRTSFYDTGQPGNVSYFQEVSQVVSFTPYLPNEIAPTVALHFLSPTSKPTVLLADDEDSSKLLSSFYQILSSQNNNFILTSSFSETPHLLDSRLNSQYFATPFLETSVDFDRTTSIVLSRSNFNETEIVLRSIGTEIPTSSIHLRMPNSYNTKPFRAQESSIFHYVSSSYPHLMSLLVERNKTHVSGVARPSVDIPLSSTSMIVASRTREQGDHSLHEEAVPPPRITNPNCNTLPICIAITMGMSWTEFCPNVKNFRKFLSDSLSQYTKPIHPDQIILSSDHHECKTSSLDANKDLKILRRRRNASTIVINIYITDNDGEYDDKLTEICGVILKIWMPTYGTPFQNRVMEVKLFHIEEEAAVPESIPSEPPTSTGIIAAITISTIAGACLVLLCILLVVMKQRLQQNRNCNPALDAYSLDSFSINASFRRRRIRQSMRSFLNHAFDDPELPSHPLSESGLINSLRNLEALEEEFKKLPMNMPKLDQIPSGAEVKNRYANVFPNPDTRVSLSAPEDDPIKEYINANYVKGYDGKPRTYIATQAPLPETVEDFWKMIWERQSRVILMITLLEENGAQRCANYFPENTLDCHKLYGDFQVSLQKKDIRECYTMSTFRLYNLEVKKNLFREVVHFWFTSWPTSGVPSDPGSLLTFLLQARPYIKCNSGPTVVHCSPGTGRTGVILALDMAMREYEESRSVDLLRCMANIRRDRGGAVQNKEQYILLHEAMAEYVSSIVNQSHRPSIRSNS